MMKEHEAAEMRREYMSFLRNDYALEEDIEIDRGFIRAIFNSEDWDKLRDLEGHYTKPSMWSEEKIGSAASRIARVRLFVVAAQIDYLMRIGKGK